MHPVLTFALCLLIAFLSGSLPFGVWIARTRGVDLKKVGSGNIGFTNVWRSVGRIAGASTLALDVLKGALPTALLPVLSAAMGAGSGGEAGAASSAAGLAAAGSTGAPFDPATAALFFGLAAILGHCFSPFVKFRGGKGVATSLGVFLVLAPVAILVCVVVFVALVAATRYISLGSVVCAVLLPTIVGFSQGVVPLFWISAVIGAMIVFLHRSNIQRLSAGTERRFAFGKSGHRSGDPPR